LFERQPSEPLLFVLSVLAVWRLTALVVYEEGPFRALERLRRVLVTLRLGRLIGCFHCLGIWLSAAVVLLVYDITRWSVLLWLAVAGAVSIIERWLGGTMAEESPDAGV
jgi:hypothetical protein